MILWGDELLPGLTGVLSKDVIIVLVQCKIVLIKVSQKIVCTQNLCNLDELIIVVSSLEERLLFKD